MLKLSDDPEVLEVHVVPSEEVRIVPLSPTATNNSLEEVVLSVVVLSVLVDPSSLLLQEMIVRLIRNVEKMISNCFTWFPNKVHLKSQMSLKSMWFHQRT